ncbi:MAG: cell division protein ZipA C-terminal FtsZ-binding domain-containing protein [Hydrogenophaga sp.]|uniref:cell division protein ZipA C-terminal FtsZ-binding domain-containing protein n=1 Tax=Hydrogenophaga sp. TaxID=1904254 RepID=UPI00272FA58C|nr:cell division protein ZipA C-terminal FtsZ-binding domain-containing protein [Hydrogenophaga sp.]MDP2163873.1 cell division protein ZipA C-terminal FtsZ-binding domain-containing protein [Hydrogenophaga sp.]MDP3477339.1 cell division protein ZipA C-terminal FtsZ-binding domain-containing protein [Hydrogenophaga sp.]
MSTLQISLAIIGGLVLAGVVAYNAWITRKSAPRTAVERVQDGGGHPAAGVDDDSTNAVYGNDARGSGTRRIDPILGDGLDSPSGGPSMADDERLPPPQVPVTLSHVVNPPEKKASLDALIDVITPLSLEGEVSGDALLAALPGTRRVGSKPFAVEGQSEATGEWETPRPGQRYRALQAGVQLANRSGALNDIEFSEFVVKVQAFSDAVGASPDFPDMRTEVARARELDAFASGHDAQLGFTLRARRAAWSPGYVAQHAARLGFVTGALPGRMVLPGSQQGQAPLLSLAFDPQAAMADDPEKTALRDIALSLEVTHVPRSEQPFVRMRQAAASLAEAMDGVITDDAGQLLSTDTMDRIGADLESLYDALDSRDLAAGSAQARRLFS